MEPAYKAGSKLFVWRWFFKLKEGDIVVAKDPRGNRLVLKRIRKIGKGKYFLVGDNLKKSTDSRHFGAVGRDHIIGKVWFRYN